LVKTGRKQQDADRGEKRTKSEEEKTMTRLGKKRLDKIRQTRQNKTKQHRIQTKKGSL
jgi:hypothetical protein